MFNSLDHIGFDLRSRASTLRKIKSILPVEVGIKTALHRLGMKVVLHSVIHKDWVLTLTWYLVHYKDHGINHVYAKYAPRTHEQLLASTPENHKPEDFFSVDQQKVEQLKDFAFIFFSFMSSDPISSLVAQEKFSTLKRALKISEYNKRSTQPPLPPHRPKPTK